MGYKIDPIGLIPIVYSKSSQLKWSEQSTIVLRIFHYYMVIIHPQRSRLIKVPLTEDQRESRDYGNSGADQRPIRVIRWMPHPRISCREPSKLFTYPSGGMDNSWDALTCDSSAMRWWQGPCSRKMAIGWLAKPWWSTGSLSRPKNDSFLGDAGETIATLFCYQNYKSFVLNYFFFIKFIFSKIFFLI